ncbi:MAG: co-chaperone DjlA [Legionellaceae bacterium]|nr:co-chaperone DjlA [Legionellaceae bacterium]
MEIHPHFTKKIWWGKMIGAFFGFLMGGPIGALFGIMIGNFFDRGLVEHFSKPFWHFYNEKDQDTQAVFFESMFLILGHIAKTNGRVSKPDIECASDIMSKMNLKKNQKEEAKDHFNNGKKKDFNLYKTLDSLQKAIGKKPTLIRLFVETIYNYIRETGVSLNKLEVLNNILASLRMAPLQQQSHFTDEFQWYETRQRAYRGQQYSNYREQQQSSSSQQNYKPWYGQSFNIDDYYTALGLETTANHQEVKKAYRRQISLNHPDKLIAKGGSEKEIKIANEKTQRIRKAYEEICKSRGWK